MDAATANPDNLRRYFHEEIDRMEASRLALLDRMWKQLKLYEVSEGIDQGFDGDRQAGNLSTAAIANAVQAARRARPYA